MNETHNKTYKYINTQNINIQKNGRSLDNKVLNKNSFKKDQILILLKKISKYERGWKSEDV